MPPKKRPPHELAPRTRYRYGDRDTPATDDHNRQSRQWRRDLAIAAMAPYEADILKALAGGVHPRRAAAMAGLTINALHGRARWDADWKTRFDAALMRGRDPLLPHGRTVGYKAGCLCPECRAAHNQTRQGPQSGDRWIAAEKRSKRKART